MKIYLCQYFPPRDDFLSTLTPTEAALMKEHGAWQSALLEQGVIVAHGPVIDPKGSYGVAIWRVADDQDIATMTAADPIVEAGVGRYECHPMPQLNARG